MPGRTIFRERAIIAYRQGTEKDIVPRLISWPIIACLWVLLVIFIAAAFLTWYVQVPTYVDGSGIILAKEDMPEPVYGETVAVVFLPPDQSGQVRVGLPASLQIGSGDMHVEGTIARVEPGILSPNAARATYRLDSAGALLATQPSVVAVVRLGASVPSATYAGSLVTAKVQIGSQRLLTLLLGLGNLWGSNT